MKPTVSSIECLGLDWNGNHRNKSQLVALRFVCFFFRTNLQKLDVTQSSHATTKGNAISTAFPHFQ